MLDSETKNPIKPQLTLRVGVTGHRHASKDGEYFRYPQDQKDRVGQQIKETLLFCRNIAQSINSEFPEFYSNLTPRLRFFSALAEGADQEAAEIALNLGENANGNDEKNSSNPPYTLECIFPFPRDEYRKDFPELETLSNFNKLLSHRNLQSVFELAGPMDEPNRPKAYEASGVLMLENIDILIAVWDGKPCPRGGTCDIVEKAQVRGIPVVWIKSDTNDPPSFWCYDYGLAKGFVDISENSISNCDDLRSEVRRLIAPADTEEGSNEEKGKAHELLRKFFEEKKPKKPGVKFYKWFRDWVAKKKRPAEPGDDNLGKDDWDRFVKLCPDVGCLKNQTGNILRSRHGIVDEYAVYYADQYRSAYLCMFFMAGLAVGIGLLALFTSSLTIKGIWTFIELGLILAITWVLIKGKRKSWHQQFLDFRMIAEHLRHARFLALAGRAGGGRRRSSVGESPSERFVEWYVRATLRELTIPGKCVSPDYVKHLKKTMVKSELDGPFGQIYYNKQNYLVLKELNEWLHRWSERLFWATAVVCGIYLISVLPYWLFDVPEYYESFIKTWLKNPLTYLAAVFPTFAATLSGIKYQGDFEAFAERSHTTQKELEALRKILTNPDRVPSLIAVGERFKTCADIMARDVGAWRMIYSFRPLDTPG